jgi:hypothetical protein
MAVRNAASMPVSQASWVHRGFSGHGHVEPWFDAMQGRTAVVCGNGAGVWEQYAHACAVVSDPIIVGVNDVGMYLPTLHHWVSLHADAFPAWRAVRDMQERPPEHPVLHSATARGLLDVWWDRLTPQFPLSGYFAMQLCWIMGARRIILCGCPGDASALWYGPRTRGPFDYGSGDIQAMVIREMEKRPDFKAAVSSLSGWTQEYFGTLKEG